MFHITQGLGPYCFLLRWSRSRFWFRSKPVWISHYSPHCERRWDLSLLHVLSLNWFLSALRVVCLMFPSLHVQEPDCISWRSGVIENLQNKICHRVHTNQTFVTTCVQLCAKGWFPPTDSETHTDSYSFRHRSKADSEFLRVGIGISVNSA